MARTTSSSHSRRRRSTSRNRAKRRRYLAEYALAWAALIFFVFGLLAWIIWRVLLWFQGHPLAVTALWVSSVVLALLAVGGVFYWTYRLPPPGQRWRHPNRTALARYYDQRGTLHDLQTMDPLDFERYVGALFQAAGYDLEFTRRTGDEGVDIRLYPKKRRGRRWRRAAVALVQCKRYADGHPVGSPELQQFSGALRHELAHKGYFVTTSSFTPAAQKWATDEGIDLIDGLDLLRWRNLLMRRERLRLLFSPLRARRRPFASAYDGAPAADEPAASDAGPLVY